MSTEPSGQAPAVSEKEIAIAQLFVEKLVSKQAEAGKWMLGSLLVINGGALVALFSNESVGPVMLKASATYFVAGIVLSIVTGAMSYLMNEIVAQKHLLRIGIKLHIAEEDAKVYEDKTLHGFVAVTLLLASSASLGAFILGSVAASDAAYYEDQESAASKAQEAADNASEAANAAMNAALEMANHMSKGR